MTCIIVCGPTASGKSDYVLSIPNAYIINGDSMQGYADLQILTARPDPNLSNHHLYGISPPNYQDDVVSWRKRVASCIEDAYFKGQTPVVVGGTGFYLDVLVNGISPIPSVPDDVLTTVKSYSDEELYNCAKEIDPEISLRLKDRQRTQRAVAVYLATSRSLFDWQKLPRDKLAYNFEIKVVSVDRNLLADRINKRFEAMVVSGAIEEVENLVNAGHAQSPIARALGFKEIEAFLEGNLSKQQMIEQGQLKTRQYAKRQITWFNGMGRRNNDGGEMINLIV